MAIIKIVIKKKFLLALFVISWVAMSGIWGGCYLNSDWVERFAILNDLTVLIWPVNYPNGEYLRAPVGYYVFPALMGKLIYGFDFAKLMLGVQTAITLFVTFWILWGRKPIKYLLLALLIYIFFSGMDAVGWIIKYGGLNPTQHIEWWAGRMQYSSMSTLMFWAPNHSVFFWLATAILYKYKDNQKLLNFFPVIISILIIVSPLAVIGLAFLYVSLMLSNIRAYFNFSFLKWGCVSLLIAIGPCVYLLSDLAAVNNRITAEHTWMWEFARYILFVTLEFGVLGYLLYRNGCREVLYWASTIFLIFIPLLPVFGPGNDLAMRATVAPLFIYCIITINILVGKVINIDRATVIIVLIVGAVTPLTEFARALSEPIISREPNSTLVEITNGNAGHYYANCSSDNILCRDRP